jgi:hypothetical protein
MGDFKIKMPHTKRKKRIIFLILAFVVSGSFTYLKTTLAAPDNELTYHGKLTDTSNVAVTDGNYDFTVVIYDAPTGGNCLWSARGNCTTPTPKSLTLTNGIFSTTLGESGDNPLTLDFSENYYLGITIGTNTEMTPRRKITPTGFALNANRLNGLTADNYIDTSTTAQTKAGSLEISDDFTVNTDDLFVDTSSGNVGIGTASPTTKLHTISTTEQLRLGYNTTNYFSTTVSPTGNVTFNAVGTGQGFTFQDNLTVTGHILPSTSDTYDLGSSTNRFRDLYLGPNSLHIGTDGDEGVISYDTTNDVFTFNKAAVFGTTVNNITGAIRWSGTDFEGYDGTEWISLTSLNGALVNGNSLDNVFTTNGLLRRTAAGTYSTITDNSTNWNTTYGWGDHAAEGYLTTVDISTNTNLAVGSGITLTDDTLTVTAAGGLAQVAGGISTTGILQDLNTLGAPTANGQFIVATGAGTFAYESGATARTSLGLGSLATLSTITTANITNGTITAADLNLTDITLADFTNDAGFITNPNDTVSGTELDGTFSTNGLLRRTAAGTYSTITDNSSNWNTAYGWGNHSTQGYLTTNQNITLTGDVTGSGTTSIATTIAPNSVALGTDTTGTYVAGAIGGSAITVTGTAGEGWSPTIAVTSNAITNTHLQYSTGQHLTTGSSPTFSNLTLSGALTNYGHLYIGSSAASGSDLYLADRIVDWDNTGYYIDPNSISRINRIDADDLRADIFYDRNNTGYYVDPASTSNMNYGRFVRMGVGRTPTADVDIYTTSGNATLKMQAAASGGWGVISLDGASSTKTMHLLYGGSADNMVRFARSGDNFGTWEGNVILFDMDAPDSSLILNQSAQLGINASPSYRLHVEGVAYATGAAGALSDVRHKKNINDITHGLDTILNLRPVAYEWIDPNDNGMEGTQLGFIAQEVEAIIPSMILTEDNAEQTKGLKYNEFVPLAVRAIQEQNTLITENSNNITTKAAATSLSQLQNLVDTELTKIDSLITTNQENILSLQTESNMQADLLADIQSDIDLINEQQSTLSSLVSTHSDTIIAINENMLFITDPDTEQTQVTISGITIVDTLKAQAIETSKIIINDNVTQEDENGDRVSAASFGDVKIDAGKTMVEIETLALTEGAKVFVTAMTEMEGNTFYVDKDYEKNTFAIVLDRAFDETVAKFDWFVFGSTGE